MPTIEELEKRVERLESNCLKLARKVFGDTITECKIGAVYKCQPGERVSTGGYIEGIEHKQDKNSKPWQSFKLAGSDGKGVYAKHFGECPDWLSEGVTCIVDEMEVGTYNNKNTYTIRKWRPYGQAQPTFSDPAMKAQAPLPAQKFAAPMPDMEDHIPF